MFLRIEKFEEKIKIKVFRFIDNPQKTFPNNDVSQKQKMESSKFSLGGSVQGSCN